ncbi:MAG: hypothetical protein ACREN5_04110, partial [Gemmatimonadales bacterium]
MLAPGRAPTLAAAVAILLLASWVLYLGPRSRLHRSLALFLSLRGGAYGLLAYGVFQTDLANRLAAYAFIAIPFAAADFAFLFWIQHTAPRSWTTHRRRRAVRMTLLLAALGAELAYLLDHGLYWGSGGSGVLSLVIPLTAVGYAGVSGIAAGAARPLPTTPAGRAPFVLAIGFAMEPAFQSAFRIVDATSWPGPPPGITVARLAVY